MSEFLGARISLISKSDIRYIGVLHEINSEESTVSLENVKSFGTEGRKGKPEEEIAPSDQVYEYIIFRGSDVKDLRIEQSAGAKAEPPPPPPAVPQDPAIVNARPRPNAAAPTAPPPPFPGPYYGDWPPHGGRGVPPMPGGPGGPGGPGFNGMPYPPPQGWFPPGPGFPPPPGGIAPWGNYYPPPPGAQTSPAPGPPGRQAQPPQQPEPRPAPIGAGADKAKAVAPPAPIPQQPEHKPFGQPSQGTSAPAPTPPVESKPSAAEVKATAASLNLNGQATAVSGAAKPIPTGPKITRITPAVPLPAALTNKSAQQSAPNKTAEAPGAAAHEATIQDATKAARDAVARAMASLPRGNAPLAAAAAVQFANGNNAMDNLTHKVNEMRVTANPRGNTGGHRGNRAGGSRGRGGGGVRPTKVEVPDADFDFALSNAKFNKVDLVREAVASSPSAETPTESSGVMVDGAKDDASPEAAPAPAYTKSSFFDNISSEAKDRADNGGHKPGGREWRDEEQRKNMETFGQGSVDGNNFRQNGYRGRGHRGRGGRGRGWYGAGGNSGRGRGGYRRGDSQAASSAQ